MLNLNSQILGNGICALVSEAAQGVICTEMGIQSGAVIGPDALTQTLAHIDALSDAFLCTEDTPSAHARDMAKRMLSEAQTYGPVYLGATTVEGFEGDLLLHWDTPTRSIVLICPSSSAKPPQIYSETLSGKHSADSNLLKDASPFDLWKSLEWILKG